MKVVECYVRLSEPDKALRELRSLIKEYPGFLSARVRLGRILFETGDVAAAVEQWEAVVERDGRHLEAQRLLRQAQAVTRPRSQAEI